ncbi:MAG: glycerophosphodiester phosphodiesterase family protein [Clostridia bacterium]|nr:glycerophosphodiester phosphodiesterase family protein [Clostridia bacterium]MDD4376046.1 glycerophosphodiester phosphodiesterase family protein [Clostridia bacterium]
MFVKRLNSNFKLLDTPITHMGMYGNKVTENSIDAITSSIIKGLPFEIDIVKAKDNIPVVWHNFNIVVGSKSFRVRDLTTSELKEAKGIPTLEECILLNSGAVPMILDFKIVSPKYKSEYRNNIINLLKSYNHEFAIQSFNPLFVRTMGRELPNALKGQLICRGKSLFEAFNLKNREPVASLYEILSSFICLVSNSDYIGLEIQRCKVWNNHLEQFLFDASDEIQNMFLELTSVVTKKPIIGWTLKNLSELNISPFVFTNYIFDPDNPDNYDLFANKILKRNTMCSAEV